MSRLRLPDFEPSGGNSAFDQLTHVRNHVRSQWEAHDRPAEIEVKVEWATGEDSVLVFDKNIGIPILEDGRAGRSMEQWLSEWKVEVSG